MLFIPETSSSYIISRISRFNRRKAIRFYFKHHSGIRNVGTEVMKHLSSSVNLISVSNEEECEVMVVFCPIVSRAGTDIEAALSHVSDDKPTIMVVLHHTFDIEYAAPNSSRYERNNLILVDMLFHEDSGLLRCPKNNTAISNAGKFLEEYSRRQHVKACTHAKEMMSEVLTVVAFEVVLVMCRKKPLDPRTVPETLFRIYCRYLLYRCYYHFRQKYYFYLQFD